MSGDAKTLKFNILFDWFDQNKDGHLTQGDMRQMAELFVGLPGGDKPENSLPLREAFDYWWSLLLDAGDADADGRIGRQEFVDIMKSRVTAPGNFEDAVIRIADAFMRVVDTTGDGSLNFAEYVQMYEGLGIDPRHSTDAFRRLDRDGAGKITHDEFRTAITEFYLSDDENAPGNWLLGPMTLTPLQIENLHRVFAMIDLSGNGVITWGDFENLSHGIADELGLAADSTEIAGLLAAYKDVWDYISGGADLDKDGAVSRDEFEKAHSTQALSAGVLLDKWQVAADRCFAAADRDNDGYIDEDALAGVYRAAGVTDRQVAAAAFQAMDLDSSGRVDKVEFSANVRGLFLAVDESMKGAHMISGS